MGYERLEPGDEGQESESRLLVDGGARAEPDGLGDVSDDEGDETPMGAASASNSPSDPQPNSAGPATTDVDPKSTPSTAASSEANPVDSEDADGGPAPQLPAQPDDDQTGDDGDDDSQGGRPDGGAPPVPSATNTGGGTNPPTPDAGPPSIPTPDSAGLQIKSNTSQIQCGAPLTLPSVEVGGSVSITLDIENYGASTLSLSASPALTSADMGEFSITGWPADTIQPGQTTSVTLTFSPHVTGTRTARLAFTSNDPTQPNCVINIRGESQPQFAAQSTGSWSSISSFSEARYDFGAAIQAGAIYIAGGFGRAGANRTELDDVQFAVLQPDGSLGSWTSTTSLPEPRGDHSSFAYAGRLYVAGGVTDWTETRLDSVISAPVLATGQLGNWVSEASLPFPRRSGTVSVYGNHVYLVGGTHDDGTTNQVFKSEFADDGSLGTWTTSAPMLYGHDSPVAVVTNGRLYVLGGSLKGGQGSAEYATIAGDGSLGPWNDAPSAPEVRSCAASFTYGDNSFFFGGNNGSANGAYATGMSAALDATGGLGPWNTLPNGLTNRRSGLEAFVYDSRAYVLGGWNGAQTAYDDVQSAPLVAN